MIPLCNYFFRGGEVRIVYIVPAKISKNGMASLGLGILTIVMCINFISLLSTETDIRKLNRILAHKFSSLNNKLLTNFHSSFLN